MLGKLREHQLFAKASKCKILKTSVEFLGQQICRGGMTLTEAKLKAAQDWATPQDVKGVRSLLGFANYYRRFVKDFATIADPLILLTKKDVEWQWGALSTACLSAIEGFIMWCSSFAVPRP